MPDKPVNLSARASQVWDDVVENYDLRTDELSTLADYVEELTIIDRLQADLAEAPLLAKGSHGGTIANPLLAEVRMHRATATSLWKTLRLPDLDGEEDEAPPALKGPMSRSESARKAAQARWGVRR